VSPRRAGPGVGLCLISASMFGIAAVFAKEAFATGVSVPALLATRFGIAAVLFWLVAAGQSRRRRYRPSRRLLLRCVALGAIGYALQAACYFTALTKMNASSVGQLLYVYPALVLLIAVGLRRESFDAAKLVALVTSAVGLTVLLRAGGSVGAITTTGALLALGGAGTYAVYITIAHTIPAELDVFVLSALVCGSAAVSTLTFGLMTGSLRGPDNVAGWGWLTLLGVFSTAVAAGTFLGGLRLVGASAAAILSCWEPVVTTLSAVIVYGDRLTAGQIAGGVLVLASIVVVRARYDRTRTELGS